MANKLTKRKYNKLLSGRNNYFGNGAEMVQANLTGPTPNPPAYITNPLPGVKSNNTSSDNFSTKAALTNLAIGAAGQIGGNLLSGGLQSGAGSALSGLGSIAANIPGPAGAIASAGLQVAGGLANRMFGSKLNKENIAKVEANIADLNTFQSNASDWDSLAANYENANAGMTFSNSYIGKDGWFSNKAAEKANAFRNAIAQGVAWQDRSLTNNAETIQETIMDNLNANYGAYGGPINISPSKKGTFTRAAKQRGLGVQEFANKVLANKEDYSTVMVKKANFARNTSKWHAMGGTLMTNGADFDTGITFIGNGGTHEDNPNEGVQVGVDPEGIPNLVEEGEVIWNDYVFSDRLKVPKALRQKYKLRGTKDLTFADASKQVLKESEERPNDPISNRGKEVLLTALASAQEQIRYEKQMMESKMYKNGGRLANMYYDGSGIQRYPGGGTAAYNRNKYRDWDNFRYKDTLLYDPKKRKYNDIYQSEDFMHWAETDPVATQLYKTYWIPENAANYFSVNKVAPTMQELLRGSDTRAPLMYDAPLQNPAAFSDAHAFGQLLFDAYLNRNQKKGRGAMERRYLMGRKDAAGTPMDPVLIEDWDPEKYQYVRTGTSWDKDTDYTDYYYTLKDQPESKKYSVDDFGEFPNYDSPLRYAPAIGSLAGLITSATTPNDYSNAEAILAASSGKGLYQPVRYNPIGNQLTQKDFDLDYYTNKLASTAAANRNAIRNMSGNNRAVALASTLASDNNYMNQMGDMAIKALESDFERESKVEDFNRATAMANSEGFLKAAMANQEALAKAKEMSLKGIMSAAELREKTKLAKEKAISDNLSNLFESLGNIGNENVNRAWRKWLGEHGYFGIPGKPKSKSKNNNKENTSTKEQIAEDIIQALIEEQALKDIDPMLAFYTPEVFRKRQKTSMLPYTNLFS